MRVGILTGWITRKAGGVFDAVRGLTKALSGLAGLDIRVFGVEEPNECSDSDSWYGIPLKVCQVLGPSPFCYSPQLLRGMRQAELSVVHVHGASWTYVSMASTRWSGNGKRPYLVTLHGALDPWALRNQYWKKRLAAFLYENNHLRRAACLHALCEAEAQSIRRYGLKNPVAVIPNGVDLPEVTPVASPNWASAIPDQAKVLLYLGRLHPKKGLPDLVRAWRAARGRRQGLASDWHLVIAGWSHTDHQDDLRSLCAELSVDDSVTFVGPQYGPDRDSTYRRADAFVLPSLSEGLPMAVLEAWSYSLPVLITEQCHLPDGVRTGSAIEIDSGVRGIGAGLETLFSLPSTERLALGRRGRRLVEERFSWPGVAADMRTLYKWLLGGGEKPNFVT